MKKRYFLFVCFLCFVLNLHAEIKVPRFFSNNMVLKQQEEITIYGIAIPADMCRKLENATNVIEALQNANYPEIKLFQISRVMSNQPEEE